MTGDGRTEAVSALQALLKRRAPAPGERCDFCAVPVEDGHRHLIDVQARRILCACRPCAIVFEPTGAAQGRYKQIPARYVALEPLGNETVWEALQLPIGLAFLFENSVEARTVAFYPGPAGATESMLSLDAWKAFTGEHPVLATLEADVEAVVLRKRPDGTRAYVVPIDAAYELVGALRTGWRGFDGGDDVRKRIDAFFERVEERARGRSTSPYR